ncbi:phage portal protein [Shouchella clausii]|uniref:Phage portal protein n=1 Tax=Shouchella clausii TaxID=79880 RepID=A0A268P6N0_SHOCL|nr:phage portal protein [Shouchella clausii]PAE90930.1 phage portal protein [Shouchella clausii]
MDNRRFSKEANIHYTYPSVEQLVEKTDDLLKFIVHHENEQCPRLRELKDYHEGNNTRILKGRRRKEDHLADHRSVNSFAAYIVDFIQGFIVGIPIKTEYSNSIKINNLLKDINRTNDADEHNSNLVLDQSIYGRAYELLYRSQNDKTRFTISDVLQTFVIYDDTVEMTPLAGVRYFVNQFKDNEKTVYLYTDKNIYKYVVDENGKLSEKETKTHAFNGVPIIEYENNRFRLGDFERVLNLIDLYDEAQSDTANYMTDLNDALLLIKGRLGLEEEDPIEVAKQMRDANLLYMEPPEFGEGKEGVIDAKYLYKQYDVQGTEAYKDRVKNDIHMFTYTPNLDDNKFAGNKTGEALKYKLFGLEQKRAIKERLFKKSLRNRYRLINNLGNAASEGEFDVNEIKITFTPNLPKSIKDEIDAFVALGGELSEQTKLSLLSTVVENPLEEIERKRQEGQRDRPTYDFERGRNEVNDDE